MENIKMTPEQEQQVISYVYLKYKSYEGKNLVVKDMGTHYEVLKHKDGGPLFLGKDIFTQK